MTSATYGLVVQDNPHIRTELRYAGPVTAVCDKVLTISKEGRGADDVAVSDTLYNAEFPVLSLISPWSIQLSRNLVAYVKRKTGCQIIYPPKESFSGEPPTYHIKGNTMENLMFAIRHLFVGLLCRDPRG